MSIAGVGDLGLPNGYPVDEWGIRVNGKIPVIAGAGSNSTAEAIETVRLISRAS